MELTLAETKDIIKYIIENNKTLQAKGEYPVAVNLCGQAGIGKTAIIRQLAKELNANFIFLSLSELTDPAELCGWPIKEHYVCKDDDCTWITGELIEAYTKAGYAITNETRMGYAIPAWLKGIDPNKTTLCVLDDYTRATPAILQACMQITYEQEYISWKLPKNTTVVLTTNPDDGSFNVNNLDSAMRTRFITFNVKFDKNDWAQYAENQGIDGRAINFLLQYGDELMDTSRTKEAKVNARNFTMFANVISGISDWSKPENLVLILQISSGCFLDDDDIVGGLFTTFIANKMDKLLSPEDLIYKDWGYVKRILEDQLYDDDKYRADIASVITTRFMNYCIAYFKKEGSKTDIITDRILKIVDNEKLLLTEDLLFNLIRTLNKNYPGKCNKLLLNPKIAKKLI
jgi:hypothetical protein